MNYSPESLEKRVEDRVKKFHKEADVHRFIQTTKEGQPAPDRFEAVRKLIAWLAAPLEQPELATSTSEHPAV